MDNEKLLSMATSKHIKVSQDGAANKNQRKASVEIAQLSACNEPAPRLEKNENNFVYDSQFANYKNKSKNRKSNNYSDFQPIHCCINNVYGVKLELPHDLISHDMGLMQKIVNKIEITEEDYRPSAKAESCHNSTGFERRNHKKNPYHQLRSGIVSNADDSADQRKAVDHKSNSGYEEKCGAKNPNKKKKKKQARKEHSV